MEINERNQMTEEYIKLASKVARNVFRRFPYSGQLEDLQQLAYIGLMDAVQRFDKDRGVKFSTYAKFRIRGYIYDELRKSDWVPRSVRNYNKQYEKLFASLLIHKDDLTEQRIAKELNISEAQAKSVRTKALIMRPNCDFTGDLVNSNDENPHSIEPAIEDDRFDKLDEREFIDLILKNASNRHVEVLQWIQKGKNLFEIGEILGITESRVSQILREIRARAKFFRKFQERKYPDVVFNEVLEIDPGCASIRYKGRHVKPEPFKIRPKILKASKFESISHDNGNKHVIKECLSYLEARGYHIAR